MGVDMVIRTRMFDLLTWLLPKSETFPKTYRFTVTQRMMAAALDVQEACSTLRHRAARPGSVTSARRTRV